jgi:SUN family beta-glucosidase
LWADAGETQELACPDGDDYYKKGNSPTSAQYYVNPKGVPIEKACQWGSPGEDVGNYAPLNIGVGWMGGKGWLSIFQNAPTTDAKLDFTVELVGDDMNGKCRYQNGQYCSGDNYENCNTVAGCTVCLKEIDVKAGLRS